jgi:hypothetical protein
MIFYATSHVVIDTIKTFSKNDILVKYRIYQLNVRNIIMLDGCYKSNKQTASFYVTFNDLDFMLRGFEIRLTKNPVTLSTDWQVLKFPDGPDSEKNYFREHIYHLSLHKPSVFACLF